MAKFILSFSGKVLEVEGNQNSPGVNVIANQKKLPALPYQLWRLEPNGDGSFWIISIMNETLVLDVEGNNNAPKARLIVWNRKYPPAPNQLFRWGGNLLESAMDPNLVVTIDGKDSKSIILFTTYGGNYQRWLVQNPK